MIVDNNAMIHFMITVKDIEKLAELSRIKIPEAEKESLVKEIDAILAYVEQIKSAARNKEKSDELGAVRNIMRDDTNAHESGIHTEKILAEAPKREGDYLKVKKIL
jgi:aspartyl-tRNA(Asn)/glutamyl-tRNA(Gln) amidotransferase subunit C